MSKKEIKSIIAELTMDILNANNDDDKEKLSVYLNYWYNELKNYSEENYYNDYKFVY